MRKKLVVSDFDDTLFFTDKAFAAAGNEVIGRPVINTEVLKLEYEQRFAIFYRAFRKHKDLLYPNSKLIEKYLGLHSDGYEIIVMSARGEELRPETRHTLEKHSIPHSKLILSDNNYSISDMEWKLRALRGMTEGYDEILFFDDRPDSINYIRERLNDPRVKFFLVDKNGEKEI